MKKHKKLKKNHRHDGHESVLKCARKQAMTTTYSRTYCRSAERLKLEYD